MQPWYAGITLTLMPALRAGYNPLAGVEMLLQSDARLRKRRVRGLETMEEQLRLFSELSEQDQIDFLMETLDDVDKGIAHLKEMEASWSAGDLAALEKDGIEEMRSEAPELYARLLVNRNKNWSAQIARMLQKPGERFVAVGALHLLGPDSVQVQLAKRGIRVERY